MTEELNGMDLPDFTGKVLHLNLGLATRGATQGESFVLEYAEWRNHAGRLFLTGRVPPLWPTLWFGNREVGVAWDNVTSYIVFSSRDEYLQATRGYKRPLLERLGLR